MKPYGVAYKDKDSCSIDLKVQYKWSHRSFSQASRIAHKRARKRRAEHKRARALQRQEIYVISFKNEETQNRRFLYLF